MPHFIKKLIAEGEHQRLDFKFEISDFRKIARTLVAFANTDGGRLLIGVKDNGSLAGVRSEEEIYMIDGAARLYCRPEISYRLNEWEVEGKKIVEVIISPSPERPHYAQGTDGRWLAYVRRKDQNLLANRVLLKVWARQSKGMDTFIRYTDSEKTLLTFLEANDRITLSGFQKLARISRPKAETILVNFIMLGILEQELTERSAFYRLAGDYRANLATLE